MTERAPESESEALAFLTDRVPVIRPSDTIAEIETLLLKNAAAFESINYIYVTDEEDRLVGVLSLKELFRTAKSKTAKEVMKRDDIVSAKPHTHEERIAYLAIDHNLKEIPVTDANGSFLGVVPPNAIFKILHREHIDSMLKFAGVHRFRDPAITIANASASTLIKKRLPWLLMGLGGSAVAAAVVHSFQNIIEQQLLLVAFIPAITYIADAVGTQSETIFIRTLAIDRTLTLKRYLWREIKVGVVLATILACAIGFLSLLFWRQELLSLILGLSFFVGIFVAMSIAIFLPWMFSRFRVDPALTSGPFDTVLSDIVSISIYFAIATLVLQLFPNAY